LEGPPETPTDLEDDDVQEESDEPDTVDCPGCGADTGATEEEIASMTKPKCSECGTRVRVR
jgi:DNA-directed RNA polymerase subunit RPC12/RpoP